MERYVIEIRFSDKQKFYFRSFKQRTKIVYVNNSNEGKRYLSLKCAENALEKIKGAFTCDVAIVKVNQFGELI